MFGALSPNHYNTRSLCVDLNFVIVIELTFKSQADTSRSSPPQPEEKSKSILYGFNPQFFSTRNLRHRILGLNFTWNFERLLEYAAGN